MGSMRAAVLEADGKLAVGQVEIEDPRPGEVLVRVTDCGVCHSDLSSLDGSFPAPTPTVLGHEAAGIVEAVGPGVTRLRAGDKAVLTPLPPCGRCYFCTRGQPTLCAEYSSALFTVDAARRDQPAVARRRARSSAGSAWAAGPSTSSCPRTGSSRSTTTSTWPRPA